LHRAGKAAVRAGSTVQDDFEQGLAAEAGAMVALALTQGARPGRAGLCCPLWQLHDLVRLLGRLTPSNLFPEAKSLGTWLKSGWHVAVAYIIGFFVMLVAVGWHPHAPHRAEAAALVVVQPAHQAG
jgi:hypothetical protein